MNKLSPLVIVLVLVGVGIGFFAGLKFEQSKSPSSGSSGFTFRQRSGSFRPVRGQILSADTKSITIKLADGSTKIILIPSSANILQTEKASASALKKDEAVVVIGTENSDGSITAQDVQLNPRIRTQ